MESRPTMFDLLRKEWEAAHDLVLDIHAAVFGRRSPGEAFIAAVVKECDVLLTEGKPEWNDNYYQVLTEVKRLWKLAEDMQDKRSAFMKEYAASIEMAYDLLDGKVDNQVPE